MVNDGNRVIVFGGMQEYGRYSNEMYELNVSFVVFLYKTSLQLVYTIKIRLVTGSGKN